MSRVLTFLSGYFSKQTRMGPGTWVNEEATERWEGIWIKDKFCAGKGRKEFNDGEVQEGKFVDGKFHGKVSAPF